MSKTYLAAATAAIALAFAQPALGEEVLVGVQLPMTGNVASWAGAPIQRGIDLAYEQAVAAGSGYAMELEDNASDKTQAITLANRFISQDKATMLLGPPTSPLAMAVAPVANQMEVPLLALGVSREITKSGPWAFKMYQNPSEVVLPTVDYLVETLQPQKVAVVYGRDNEAMVAYRSMAVDYLKEHGVEEVMEESVLTADTDFTALATKLTDAEPDAIFLATLPEAAANIVIQARQAGLPAEVRLFGSDSLGARAYAEIGGAAVEGTIYPALFFVDSPDPANQAFVEAYRAKYGADPDQYAAIGFGAMSLVAEAIKQAGPAADRGKVRDALGAIRDFPVPLGAGKLSFDADRNPVYGVVLVSVSDGKPALVR